MWPFLTRNTRAIRLQNSGRVVASATLDGFFGKKDFYNVHDDAKYLSDPQFRFFRTPDGQWNIEHVAGANNETLVDGRSIRQKVVLASGMTISVGNSAKGIQKFPLTIDIDAVPKPSKLFSWAGIGSSAVPKPSGPVNWAGLGSGAGAVFRVAASAIGIFLGALLAGLFRGASPIGSGHTRIHRGASIFDEVILTIDGTKVREGSSMFGQVIMTIDGAQIRRGDSIFGPIIASLDGQTVREGDSMFGAPIATIDGDSVREGSSIFGTTIAKIEGGGGMAGAAAAAFLLRM